MLKSRLLTGVVLATLCLTGTELLASPPKEGSSVRYQRPQKRVKSRANLIDTRVKAAKKEAEASSAPAREAAEFEAARHKAVEAEMADRQITYLKKLVSSSEKNNPDLPGYLFRIADHQLEKKTFFDLQAGALYPKIHDAKEDGKHSLAKQLTQKQRKLMQRSKEASKGAAQAYAALVNDPAFSNYKHRDEALYYYAFELGQLGRDEEMQRAYRKLINEHPDSAFLPQAYLAFADHHFGKGNIQNAVRLYEKVIQFKGSPVYAYALYKLGWCHLNPIGTAPAKYDRSLDYFVRTIEATKQGRAGSEEAGRQLRRDARRDLVRAFVHAAQPSRAWEAFGKWGMGPNKTENDRQTMMKSLGNAYFGEGKYVESTHVYEKLQAEYADDAEVCDWQGSIVVNSLASDDKRVQWREISQLADAWTAMQGTKHKKAVRRRCRDLTHDALQSIATTWHSEASKTDREETWDLAAEAYQAFLRVFPQSKEAYGLQYWYAELLWSRAGALYASGHEKKRAEGKTKFREAHAAFVRVLDMRKKGEHTKGAAYAQMLALKNALEYDETGGKKDHCRVNTQGECVFTERRRRPTTPRRRASANDPDPGIDVEKDYPVTEYTDDEREMLAAYERYEKFSDDPSDDERAKIAYHRVLLMVRHNRYDEARPLLEKMVQDFDGTVYAVWCAEMLIDGLTIAWQNKANTPGRTIKAGRELGKWGTRMAEMKLWRHPEATSNLHRQVPTLLAGIGWREAEEHRLAGARDRAGQKGGDPKGFEKCAARFVQIFNDHAGHDRGDDLLWNAAECSQAAYQVRNAIDIRTKLLTEFPKSKHHKETLRFLAESYQAVAWYKDAAKQFEQYATRYPKDEHTPDALNNAYLFRVGLGQAEEAAEDLSRYESLYKRSKPEKAASIFWSRRGLIENEAERLAHAREYVNKYGNRGGVDRRIVAEATIGQILWRRSCEDSLLFDSCVTVKRRRNTAGVRKNLERQRLEEEIASRKRGKYKPPRLCGSDTQGLLVVHKRNAKKAREAQDHLRTALKLSKNKKISIPADQTARQAEFQDAVGLAMVYQADVDYETYLSVDMPQGLDFYVEEWMEGTGIPKLERRFREQKKRATEDKATLQAWFQSKDQLGSKLLEQYAEVRGSGSRAWTLAAAARSGMLQQNFADQLYRAEVPRHFKTQDETDAYCFELGDIGMKVEKRALTAFQFCLDRSTEFAYFNEFSRMCEVELQQRDAETYPSTNEMFGDSTYTASRIESVRVKLSSSR
jgi:TolA-binding protein